MMLASFLARCAAPALHAGGAFLAVSYMLEQADLAWRLQLPMWAFEFSELINEIRSVYRALSDDLLSYGAGMGVLALLSLRRTFSGQY